MTKNIQDTLPVVANDLNDRAILIYTPTNQKYILHLGVVIFHEALGRSRRTFKTSLKQIQSNLDVGDYIVISNPKQFISFNQLCDYL